MLVRKSQPHFPSSSTYNGHKRQPVANGAHVVQPTRTPGLLSLSKPLSQPTPRTRPSPKTKPINRQSLPALAQSEPSDSAPFQTTATPEKRGRQAAKSKDAPRNLSQRRSHKARQPSPADNPTLSSQAEDSSATMNDDPFFDNFSSSSPPRPSNMPKLAPSPSGKLARRRQQAPGAAPASTASKPKPIPVPKPQKQKAKPQRASVALSLPFRVCDDSDDLSEGPTPPSTPTRSPARAQDFADGPKTAPIKENSVAFPFFSTPSPPKSTISPPKRHKRAPSEGAFHSRPRADGSKSQSNDLQALLGLLAHTQRHGGAADGLDVESMKAAIAGHFANSTFQNSPSPDDLPPPAF